MAASSPGRFSSTFLRVLAACAAGGVAAALVDVVLAAARASDPIGAGPLARGLVAAIGLWAAAAIPVGAIAGLVAASVRCAFPAGWLAGAWRSLRAPDGDERDAIAAAALLASGVAAGLLAAIVLVYLRAIALEMAAKRNAALSTALVAAAALPLAALGAFPAHLLLRPLARRLPRPRVLWALGAMVAVVALGAVAAIASVDWRVIDFGPFLAAAWFAAFALAHLAALWRGPVARLRARLPLPSLAAIGDAPIWLAIGALAAASALPRFGAEPRSLSLVADETSGARPIVHALRKLADRDHDGYSAILGGGDCDDRDPSIHPGALDVPGDGIDQDCEGGDATPLAEAPAPATEPAKTKDDKAAAFRWGGNLVVITVDTLRADRLDAKHMPHVAALAKQATVFTHAYAQAPNTPRSFPSFLTSRLPSRVPWQKEFANYSGITDGATTFFEVLHDAGLHTVGEFSHFYLEPKNGVAQGFDEWDDSGALSLHDSNTDIAAPRITEKVKRKIQELAASKRRFVLWTHFFEPHSRYMEHPEFPAHGSGFKLLESKYDGEVAFVDLYVQQVLDALAAAGLDGKTAVVLFSDHGEAFGEHRAYGEQMFFHGQTLYDELLRVPLLVRVPGVPGHVVDGRVMLTDLGPTLADLVKAKPAPDVVAGWQGRSLLGAILGEPLAPRPVYAEMLPAPSWNHSWRVLIDGGKKLIQRVSDNGWELYDLAGDPTEQHNLAFDGGDAAVLARLKQELLAASARGPRTGDAPTRGTR